MSRTRARRPIIRTSLPLIAIFVASACASAAAQSHTTLPPVIATLPASGSAAAAATTPAPRTSAPATASTSPSASAATSASPSGSASGSSSQSLVAAGKVVFQTTNGEGCQACHGPDAKGMSKDGNTAPNIRGATEQKLRDALRGGVPLMSNIKLTDDQITAVLAFLAYLDQQ